MAQTSIAKDLNFYKTSLAISKIKLHGTFNRNKTIQIMVNFHFIMKSTRSFK